MKTLHVLVEKRPISDFQDFELLIAFLQIRALYKHVTINFYLVMVTYVIRHEDCQIQKSFIIYY